MKKSVVLLLSLMLLAGCSSGVQETNTKPVETESITEQQPTVQEEVKDAAEESKKNETPASKVTNSSENQSDLPPVVDGVLTVPGQTTKFEYGGTLELKKIMEPKANVMSGPLKITVESIKLFEVSGLSEEYHAAFSQKAGIDVGSSMNYVQIVYNMENTKDHDIEFFGLDKAVLSNGQQIERTSSFLKSTFGDSVFYGPVKQKETLALVYDGTSDDIDSIRLIFGPVYDAEDKGISTLSETKKLNLNF